MKKVCKAIGCQDAVICKGYCRLHSNREYSRQKSGIARIRDTPVHLLVPNKINKPCKAIGCEEPWRTRGYCTVHYAVWNRRQKSGCKRPIHLLEPLKRRQCRVKGCDKMSKPSNHSLESLGPWYCDKHYCKLKSREKRGYDIEKYPLHKGLPAGTGGLPNGTRRKVYSAPLPPCKIGTWYWKIKAQGHPLCTTSSLSGRTVWWVHEHRIVMYDKVGSGRQRCFGCKRSLTWKSKISRNRIVVNHLDENGLNNRLKNLVISCIQCNREWSLKKHLDRKFD